MLHIKYVRYRTLEFSSYAANAKITAMLLNGKNESVATSTQ